MKDGQICEVVDSHGVMQRIEVDGIKKVMFYDPERQLMLPQYEVVIHHLTGDGRRRRVIMRGDDVPPTYDAAGSFALLRAARAITKGEDYGELI